MPEEFQDHADLVYQDDVKDEVLNRDILSRVVDETQKKQATGILIEEQRFVLQQRRAKMFSLSGLFAEKNAPPGSVQGVARAMIKIELGESMGFSPAEALQGIYVINGQTCVSSALRAARMQAAGYDWDIQWHGTEENCLGITLWIKFCGKPLLVPIRDESGAIVRNKETGEDLVEQARVSFKHADAAKMLTTMWVDQPGSKDRKQIRCSILEKDNWRMTPKNMYFARAVTNAQRWYAPKVLSAALMSAEEAMDLGDVIEETERRRESGSREQARTVISDKIAELKKQGIHVAEVTQDPKLVESTESDHIKALANYRKLLGTQSVENVCKAHGMEPEEEITPDQFAKMMPDLEKLVKSRPRESEKREPEKKNGGQKGFEL